MDRIRTFAAFACALLLGTAHAAGTLDQVKQSGKIALGYRSDARPFSFKDDSGNAAGYSAALCASVAAQVKTELNLGALSVTWVPVTLDERFEALRAGKVDLLCGADTVTLARRQVASFSIPIYLGGVGALLRSDAPAGLVRALSERPGLSGPLWRGTPTEHLLQVQTFAVVSGTTSERALADRMGKFQLTAKIEPVKAYADGVRAVLDRKASVFFGDRPILLDAAKRAAGGELAVIDRRFTDEQIALAMRRGDEDFRLAVDRALSKLYGSSEFRLEYAKWFGPPDERAAAFFRAVALPE